jgi:outer membrane protein insertion porin family
VAATLLTTLALASGLAWGHATVSDVRLDAPGAQNVALLRRVFGVTAGATLSREAIRRGVEALMATGAVEDVRVAASPVPGGVALDVHVQVASRVSMVAVVGLSRHWSHRVVSDLALERGARLRVARFEEAIVRQTKQLHDAGYPDATLDPELDFDDAAGTVSVLIRGSLGPPLRVASVAVSGVPLAQRTLADATGLKPGHLASVAALEQARRRLAARVRRKGWWEAVVDDPHVEKGPSGARLRFPVQPGPIYRLKLEGLAKSRTLEAQALPFLTGAEPFSETALTTTLHAVRTYLAREGYLLAKVDGEVTAAGPERVLSIHVARGRRTPIVAVRFVGVAGVPEEKLKERVGARRGHPWRWGNEPVDEDTLDADGVSLQATLHDLGYADATVAAPSLVAEGDGVAIEFRVEQGRRYTVGSLGIHGVPAAVKTPRLALKTGGPWSEAAEGQARESLLSALRDGGYPDGRVAAAHICKDDVCKVDLTATPGAHAQVDRVVVSGLVRVKRSVVDRVGGLKPGAWIGPTEQLAAQRRLLGLGIFRSASLHPIPDQDYGPSRGMVLDLLEAPSRALSFGIGWNTVDRLRLTAGWSELNLFGLARTLSFETTLSSREKRYEVSYREPARLGLLGFPSAVAVFRSEERLADYNFLRRGMWIEFGDRLRRPARFLLRYDYQIVHNDAPDAIKSELERDKQNIAIAMITPIAEWDTRDDVFSPARGVYASVQLANAFKAFSADVSLERLEASIAAYHKVGSGVLAVALHGGAIEPRGAGTGAEAGCTTDNCLVPIAERFFAGGRVSQRAFATDMLGIPGKTLECKGGGSPPPNGPPCELVAVGGAGLLLANTEWRVPVWGPIGASVFLDGGNVWAAWRDVRVGQMRWGAGLGVRVTTPVGPFRLEYGWKFDRKPGESAGELFLSFGNPF